MSMPEDIPLPSDSGILGSRKIRLKRTSPGKPQVSVSEALPEVDHDSENSTPLEFDSPITNDSKSSLVDSVFSNFVAKKMEAVEKERKDQEDSGKKVKHKKEKHKKHKHKDKEKSSSKKKVKNNGGTPETGKDPSGGFFAKEKFLDPGVTEEAGHSDNSELAGESDKSKKHKKHKKHKEHKHKHKSRDKDAENSGKKQESSSSKLLSFHEDMLLDPDLSVKPVKQEVAPNGSEDGAVAISKKLTPKNMFADRMEKALELKLSALKENLTKKHKVLEDLGKEVTIPEKKIKMMADFTVSEKLKGLMNNSNSSKSQSVVGEVKSVIGERLSIESVSQSVEVVSEAKTPPETCEEMEENHEKWACYADMKDGKVTNQMSNSTPEKRVTESEQDEDGFRAMKPKRKFLEEKEGEEVKDSKLTLGSTTVGKKPLGISLGLKLSENSKSLISSGVKIENDPKKRNREEGEITDSQEDSQQTSSSSVDSDDDSSSGEIKEDKAHRKKKAREKRRRSSDRKKRGRSRSKTPRKRHRSRSRSYDEERGVWKSKSRRRRSRSRSRDRRRRSRDRDYRRRSRSRSRERRDRNFYYNDRYRKSRSRERSTERTRKTSEDLRLKIDKAKLRQIAMKNAYAMLSSEDTMKSLKPDQLAAIKAGGKSVEELTDFCRKIAERDPRGNSSSDEEFKLPSDAEEDATQPFLNHPFAVKPTPNIALNIRNAKQLPVTTFADRTAKASELRLQFPVSSGSQHKNKEDEWTPVEKTTAPPTKPIATATTAVAPTKVLPKPGAIKPPAVVSTPVVEEVQLEEKPAVVEQNSVFTENKNIDINISDVVSERLSAMRKLQSNPNDSEAIGAMYKAQKAMNDWAVEKQEPGKFTGHTGLKGMSQRQLQGTGMQAWIKKDMFQRAAPVRGGIGKLLLQKMGWREGTGLGKDETGDVQPLNLDIKVDRKGLSVADEVPTLPVAKTNKAPPVRDLSGKHPVSALMEICKRRKWNQPQFDLVFECGPPHKKNFVFKVHVNGVDYQPTVASPNKKHAKAQAATVALQSFGLIPKDDPV